VYGTALCPEEANCTLAHTQLHTIPVYPFSFHLLTNTQRQKMIIQKGLSRTACPRLAIYISYATRYLLLNFLLRVYSHLCRKELKGHSQSISGLERLIPLGWENICPAPPVLPGDVSILRRCSRGIGGTLHTIRLPLYLVSVESIIFLLLCSMDRIGEKPVYLSRGSKNLFAPPTQNQFTVCMFFYDSMPGKCANFPLFFFKTGPKTTN
jgi:hypothetical protein